jgi:hypothetical protein
MFEPCWTSDNANRVLETEALGGSDAVFLATHTPIEGFSVKGSQATELNDQTERELLRVLSRSDRRHAFCIVHGEPGSGKSHFIKWLDIKWPKQQNDVVLLIRRADGSLEGTLKQLKDKLGPEFSDLFKDLRHTTKVSDIGRARSFLSRIADALDPDYFESPLDDVDWCREYRPAALLGVGAIRDRWESPRRILQLIEGGGESGRNSESATFNLLDIRDLLTAGAGSVRGSGVGGGTEKLWEKLRQESDLLGTYLDAGWLVADIEVDQKERFPYAMKLLAAINRRRNEAVQGVMGITPAGLKKLFQSVRQKLDQSGQRLVLLLEDITSFQGVDDSLIDVLVDDKGTQVSAAGGAICPIISVVGVTPKYYGDLQGNYRQRATHEVFLGEDSGGLQDVALLRERSKRERFVVRYLSAVRSGEQALQTWMLEGETDQQPPPNACSSCAIRSRCFSVFGDVDGVGTFPFTPFSIDRFFHALKLDDLGQTWRTPRGIIQAILGPSLRNTQSLEAGAYPGQHVFATSGLSEESLPNRVISSALQRRIQAKLPGDPETEQRIARLIAFWGSPKSEDTKQEGEALAFAGVKQGIFEAFNLPWIGNDVAAKPLGAEEEADANGEAQQTPSLALVERENSPPAPAQEHEREQLPIRPRTTATVPAPRPPRKTTSTELERLQNDLQTWAQGERPIEVQIWNRLLSQIILAFDLRRFGISPALLNEVLSANKIKIAGSSDGARDSFEVGRTEWAILGLESLLTQNLGKFESDNDRERGLRRLARFIRQLEEDVAAYITQRIPNLENGDPWQPIASLTQILFARAIIRGDVGAGSSLADCLRIVLSDSPPPRGDRQYRSAQWREFLEATDVLESGLRKKLRRLTNLEGGSIEKLSGMIDTSLLLPAIEQMRIHCKFLPGPPVEYTASKDLEKARLLVREWDRAWVTLFAYEQKQVEGRAKDVASYVGDDALLAHCRRIDALVERTSELLPTVLPDQVTAWKQAFDPLILRFNAEIEKQLTTLLDQFEGEEWSGPETRFDRYCHMAALPVADLEVFRQTLRAGHTLIGTYLQYAEDQISGSGNVPDADILKTAGKKFADFARVHATFEASGS